MKLMKSCPELKSIKIFSPGPGLKRGMSLGSPCSTGSDQLVKFLWYAYGMPTYGDPDFTNWIGESGPCPDSPIQYPVMTQMHINASYDRVL